MKSNTIQYCTHAKWRRPKAQIIIIIIKMVGTVCLKAQWKNVLTHSLHALSENELLFVMTEFSFMISDLNHQ